MPTLTKAAPKVTVTNSPEQYIVRGPKNLMDYLKRGDVHESLMRLTGLDTLTFTPIKGKRRIQLVVERGRLRRHIADNFGTQFAKTVSTVGIRCRFRSMPVRRVRSVNDSQSGEE